MTAAASAGRSPQNAASAREPGKGGIPAGGSGCEASVGAAPLDAGRDTLRHADHFAARAVSRGRVRGWCPGALRPMESGDGLIVRLKLSLGVVGGALAQAIAQWSRDWGNGEIDLTSRANLQLRGVTTAHLPSVHAALAQRGLLDSDPSAEAVRNIICSPLSGLDPGAVLDIRPIVRQLEARLARDPRMRSLPGKFGFAVDDGGRFGLAGVPADIRFVATRQAGRPGFAIHLDGAPLDGLGGCRPDALADTAIALAGAFLRLRSGSATGIRRMRDLVAAFGVPGIARAAGLAAEAAPVATPTVSPPAAPGVHAPGSSAVLGVGLPFGRVAAGDLAWLAAEAPPGATPTVPAPAVVGVHALGSSAVLGVGLPFGRIAAGDLAWLAAMATTHGGGDLHLTPWRAVLVPLPSLAAARALLARMDRRVFVVEPGDPRLRVAACPGAPACVHATTPVRDDAARLAAAIPAGQTGSEATEAVAPNIMIHISGCEKGCACRDPAAVTLVGRDGRYDLVRDGNAADPPMLRDLSVPEVVERLGSLLVRPADLEQPR